MKVKVCSSSEKAKEERVDEFYYVLSSLRKEKHEYYTKNEIINDGLAFLNRNFSALERVLKNIIRWNIEAAILADDIRIITRSFV